MLLDDSVDHLTVSFEFKSEAEEILLILATESIVDEELGQIIGLGIIHNPDLSDACDGSLMLSNRLGHGVVGERAESLPSTEGLL